MYIKNIAGVCFFLAMLFAVLLLLDVSVPLLPRVFLAYGVIGLGIIGIILNLLNVQQSKHSILYSIVYWSACLFLVIGIGMRIMHWPFSKETLFIGVIVMLISFFIPKSRKEDEKDTGILDDF